ncbi:MAG: DNA alkylation repair protein [Planctomycetaceae bacterium]|nr:DNA alkylation repair protein [Planctomycetaceae bacterium]
MASISSGKMGDIKKCAKEVKTDHTLAQELWAIGEYLPRMLAVLIFDKKQLDETIINQLTDDMQRHEGLELNQLADWLMANQLMKSKPLTELLLSWEDAQSPIQRRLFWYHQGRLRWTGQTPPDNTPALLKSLEQKMADEEPVVQWAMNLCAGWIGVFDPQHRSRCVKLGKKLGLYKGEKVPRGCTPSYLPEFIRMEAEKREL